MALIISGVTLCVLCGRTILRADEAVGFPAFLPVRHRLHPFSDAAFHTSCYQTWHEKAEFEGLYLKYRSIWDRRPKDLRTAEEIDAWGREAFAEFLNDEG